MRTSSAGPDRPAIDADSSIHIPAFTVPLSKYMSEQAKRHFIEEALHPSLERAVRSRTGGDANASVAQIRAGANNYFRPIVEWAKALHPVNMDERIIVRRRHTDCYAEERRLAP